MINRPHNQFHPNGFTLIELAIVILIIGLFIGTIAQGLKLYVVNKQEEELDTRTHDVRAALANYFNTENEYPCPAPLTGPNAGQPGDCTDTSQAVGSCNNGVCVAQGTNGRRIRIGGLPYNYPAAATTRLDLALADTLDPFDNQMTYAVTEHLATPAYASGQGDIRVDDIRMVNGAQVVSQQDNQEFVFFSHGRDGSGAYNANGVLVPNACGVGVDAENCDGDATFVTSLVTSQVSGAAHFDDALTYSLQFAPINVACPAGQVMTAVADGNAVCGEVAEANQSCPNNQVAVGTDAAGNILCRSLADCGAGQVLRGLDTNGNRICVADQRGTSISTRVCSAGEAVTGINANGSVTCGSVGGLSCTVVTRGGGRAVSVSCPAGTRVTGGGCNVGATDHYSGSYPSGNGWACRDWKNNSGRTAYAVCCR